MDQESIPPRLYPRGDLEAIKSGKEGSPSPPLGGLSSKASSPASLKPSLDSIKPSPGLVVSGTASFTWIISNWSSLQKQGEGASTATVTTGTSTKITSPEFISLPSPSSNHLVENTKYSYPHKWRILLFPNGNRGGVGDTMSVFLECLPVPAVENAAAAAEAANLHPDGTSSIRVAETSKWHVCGYFQIVATNAFNEEIFSTTNSAHHRFNEKETDWGFSQFCNHASLTKPIEGSGGKTVLENDSFAIKVFVKEVVDENGALWHNFVDWDSKLETGYVGIKNQGATCYLNSLIQSLYFTNYFRQATYEIPTQNDDPSKSVAYALQRLFYHMQFAADAVSTSELTKSFGWDTMDAFHQHDVQELNRVLQDNLENTMKGTRAEGAIRKLFTGRMKSYIKCVDVEFESTRVEDYYDIQLNVKGCKNLHESFVDYCKVEMLDGENKYFAEGFGLQDAKKGVIFESFPPVLHLQLKRFDYDMERDQFVKINDRHEFPMSIDVAEFLSADADRSVSQKYLLQGVLVHSGDLNAGHYYALLRPQKGGRWFKFDDDKVVPATEYDVLEANFGGEVMTVPNANRTGFKASRFYTNAYMLVYIREGDEDEILSDVTEDQIPIHLRNRVKRDMEEAQARRIEEQERHLYMQVHVVNDNDLVFHSGFDIGFPLDPKKSSSTTTPVRVFKAKREHTLNDFLELYANEINVDASQVRLWNIVCRQNKTYRIESPYPPDQMNSTLSDTLSRVSKRETTELRIYAQLASSDLSREAFAGSPRFGPMGPVEKDILIFIKQYDPFSQAMRVVLTVSVRKTDLISTIIPAIYKVSSFPDNQNLILYEEVKPGMVEQVEVNNSFSGAELVDGDILCFQPRLSGPEMDSLPDPTLATAPGYFEMLQNRVEVNFKHRGAKDASSQELTLVLNKKMNYEQVVSHLSNEIHHDPAKIKLFTSKVNGNVGMAISQRNTVQEMISSNPYSNQSFLLYYELLDISLEELERKRYLKLSFLEHGVKEHGPHSLLIEKTATFEDVVAALFQKLQVEPLRHVRAVEVVNSRRTKILSPADPISIINEYGSLYIESFDEEELELAQGQKEGKMVEVFHFSKDVYRSHSLPFTFLMIPGEIFSATKERLANRMAIARKEFDKIKVAIVSKVGKPVYPADDDVIELDLADELSIGLDHIDRGRKSGGVGGVKIN